MITLRAKLPSGRNEKVTISQEATLRDLTTLLASSFPEVSNPGAGTEQNITLLHGFPPKKLNAESQDALVSTFFRNMEPVIVQLQGGVSQAASSLPPSKSTATSKPGAKRKPPISKASSHDSSPTVKSPKLSFGANIHSISASSSAAGPKKTGKGKTAGKAKVSSKAPFKPTFGATTATLSTRGGFNARSKGTGGLCASKSRSGSRTNTVSGNKRKSRLNLNSQDDIGTSLLTAVSAGSGGGKKNRFLRGTFRRAVALEYEASQAQARVMSLLSGKYSIQESQTARTLGSTAGRSEAAQIIVQYHKGHGNRSFHFETVDLLSRAQLKAVVRLLLGPSSPPSAGSSSDVTNTAQEEEEEEEDGEDEGDEDVGREMLRARYMAKCSPRVFWSLVHHYGPSIPAALSQLLPELDWTWLVSDEEAVEGEGGGGGRRRRDGLGGGKDGDSVRRRQLSEKARENQRQARAAAAEAQEKKDMKRLLAEAKNRKLNRLRAGSGEEEKELAGEDEKEVEVISAAVTQQRQLVEDRVYRGPPVDVAEDMLRVLLLTGYDERGVDAGKQKFELFIAALREVFQISRSYCSSSSSSSGGSNREQNFSVDLLHALADTCPPPLGSGGDDGEEDGNEEDMSGSFALLQTIQTQLQSQWQARGILPNETTIPFITLSHLRFWIRAARWMLVTHFWAVEEYRGSEHGTRWVQLLSRGGIRRVRDLSLWRHAPGDLITFLRDGWARDGDGGDEMPRVEELGFMCQLAESFRDQCDWVDEWTDSDLATAHETVHSASEGSNTSESWYRSASALPRYCFDLLPEAVLLELNPICSSSDDTSTGPEDSDAWEVLADQACYEEVLCLRQYAPPTAERLARAAAGSSMKKEDDSVETLPACLGRRVSLRVTDGDVIEPAAGGTGGGAGEGEVLRGVVVAYVPPTDEEPMALWKVLLHTGQWQDLEQHELRLALS